MIIDLKAYPDYKDSGVPWLGDVPEHWEVRRQRNIVDMLVSNIDKHTVEGEFPVRLCNYVDVYKNERITGNIPFMRATASKEEVRRFRLQAGDVIITKDSESWDDIGVPALVGYTAPDLVCGYHLAILRPREGVLEGRYLLRALQSQGVATQYHVSANGVTRYGLSHDAIKSILLPLPPLAEQSAIVRVLDHSDRRIRRYIRAKQKLIALLEEQKQAIIHHAVTRGLDPNVHLKPSGVGWLGDVPEHWHIRPAKRFFREVDERSITGEEELLSVSHLTGVTPRSQKNITMFMAESYAGHKMCRPGDLVINTMWAWMAALGVARQVGIVSPAYGVYRPLRDSGLLYDYADLLFRTKPYVGEYICRSTGIQASRLRLYPEQFLRIAVVCPPVGEQQAILEHISVEIAETDRAIEIAHHEISLLREYRTRLIADVVTGKLDVREAAARLPDETEELEPFMDAEVSVEGNEPGDEPSIDTLDETET
ncbi:MAG: restriction endonuclease subunit S [Acidiferrobacteraceae bacterium]